jgi:hypothetical protein
MAVPAASICSASRRRPPAAPFDTTERRLAQDEYRTSFNALIERGTYVSGDALNGGAYGKVCCEQTTALRDWRAGEVMALRAIVTRLALLMSGATESVLWTTPSLPLQAL